MSEKSRSDGEGLKAALGSIEKAYGKGAVLRLGEKTDVDSFEVIRSGSLALDEALGIGGYPRGRIVEVFGPSRAARRR
jgi:recombination protein RecA